MNPKRFKLVLVNDSTGERRDSLLKGADMLSNHEVRAILKRRGHLVAKGWRYEKEQVNP